MTNWILGVIGGSGLYDIDGLENCREESVDTPWGSPSGLLTRGRLGSVELVFLPRHGAGHVLTPSTVNYRANIAALKQLGCTDVLSISAVGSLQDAYAPGDFVMIDQFIDRTIAREKSFFGPGCVAHVSMADPICERLSIMAGDAAEAAGAKVHRGGTYLAMEGPQFSTRAESHMYRAWGCDVIGMTNMPEAKLAREAELPYATVAMVTDYDCWRETEAAVSVEAVLEVLGRNSATAKSLIKCLADALSRIDRTPTRQGIERALDFAVITAPEAREPELVEKLTSVAGRVLG
ncbi:MAG: S-methyl-5'-thioadenosine phosphorylase [Pseudomonadota bacterium]